MNKKFKILDFLQTRPLSWSAISSFDYDHEQWYQKYIMGVEQMSSPEMLFGKAFADSCELRKPLAPVTMLSKMEHSFESIFNGIPLIGYADTIDEATMRETGEYKTGVKQWDQKRADNHGQIKMYALQNYLNNKIRPEDCKFWLEWIPTKRIMQSNGFNYSIEFDSKPAQVLRFNVKVTMQDILKFGSVIKSTVNEMEKYVQYHN